MMTQTATMTSRANEITFGIELECYIPTAKVDFTINGYHSSSPTSLRIPGTEGWSASSDGSIQAGPSCRAVEIVSPVLKGRAGMNQVIKILEWLKSKNAGCNKTCGFHVHVGCGQNAEQARRYGVQVLGMVAQHEGAFWAASGVKGRTRENNRFCNGVKSNATAKENYKSFRPRESGCPAGSRYQIVNLSNIWSGRFNAVEFRAFAATFRVNVVLGIIRMCVGVVDYAMSCRNPIKWDSNAPKRSTGLDLMVVLMAKLGWGKKREQDANWGWVDCDFGPEKIELKKTMINQAKVYELTIPLAVAAS